jgi:hypothetical protein
MGKVGEPAAPVHDRHDVAIGVSGELAAAIRS